MSTKNIKCYRNLPVRILCKANGYWNYDEIRSFENDQNYHITMQEYDGLSYSIHQSDLNTISADFKTSLLPNYLPSEHQSVVLMPYDDGKVYHNVNIQRKNVDFNLVGCTVSDTNELSGFSTGNYAQITKAFPSSITSMDWIFKCTTGTDLTSHHNCLTGRSDSTERTFIIRSTNQSFSYYNGSWVTGTTTLTTGTTYWFRVIKSDGTLTGYILIDNGEYTLDTLPDISEWTQEWTSTTDAYSGASINIGWNNNAVGEYNSGSFDLNNCKITVNGEDFWYYDMITEVSQDIKGCLYNYTDTGAAATLNCFYYNNTYVISSDEDIEGGVYLGQVSVPAHNLYSYSETPYQVYDNFTVVGTTLNIDQETGKVSGFGTSSYLNTGYIPRLSEKTPWAMRVRFKYHANETQYYLCYGYYTNGPVIMSTNTNQLASYITSNGNVYGQIVSTFNLEDGMNYIVELNYDGDRTYTLRYRTGQQTWQTVGTIDYTGVIEYSNPVIIGSNQTLYYCYGIIDLSTDTYFEIDGVKTWIPTTMHYNTTWEKKS